MAGEEENKSVPLTAVIEALLFLSPYPLNVKKLQEICHAGNEAINSALKELQEELSRSQRGIMLVENSEGFQLATKPETALYAEKFWGEDYEEAPLSQAALETLAIIAVKQPVTRMEIEKIRGVKTERVIENLLNRELIEIKGRKEALGKPILYGTTDKFLQEFGLKEASDLEQLNEELSSYLPENGETK